MNSGNSRFKLGDGAPIFVKPQTDIISPNFVGTTEVRARIEIKDPSSNDPRHPHVSND